MWKYLRGLAAVLQAEKRQLHSIERTRYVKQLEDWLNKNVLANSLWELMPLARTRMRVTL